MSKVTFVVEFEDGKEPAVNAGMTIFGGSSRLSHGVMHWKKKYFPCMNAFHHPMTRFCFSIQPVRDG